ncbi:MAG: 3-dehydroquinate synthase [bacterium]
MFEKKIFLQNDQIAIVNNINDINPLTESADLIITDTNLKNYYNSLFSGKNVYVIPAGEKSKSLKTIEEILSKMLETNCIRDSIILGVGGGVVCDITGFASAIYMRGVRHSFIATSLLAQCDAAIGGKNGVNLNNVKNICGTFKQPENIFMPINMLKTLPGDEMANGMAEVLKTALVVDKELFNAMAEYQGTDWKQDDEFLNYIVFRSALAKSEIVAKDEKDNTLRRILNFGHTFGHAIESTLSIPHGKAVAWGMVKAFEVSNRMGLIAKNLIAEIISVMDKFELTNEFEYDKDKIKEYFRKDKKRKSDIIQFIALNDIGSAEIIDVHFSQLDEIL